MLGPIRLAEPHIRAAMTPVTLVPGRAGEGRAKPFAVIRAEPPEALGSDHGERIGVFFVDCYADYAAQAYSLAEDAEVADGMVLSDQETRIARYRSTGITGPLWSEDQQAWMCRVTYEVRYRKAGVLARLGA